MRVKFLIIILPTVTTLLVVGIVNYQFYNYSVTNPFYNGCYSVWAHSGYHKVDPYNSIENFSEAFDRGAKGVEIDIIFDNNLQDFIVSHDYPYSLVKGKLLTLENVFSAVGDRGYLWVDFKQLDTVSDVDLVVDKMERLLKKFNLMDKVIIESRKGILLRKFSQKSIHTSYWIAFSPNGELFPFRFKLRIKDFLSRSLIGISNFSAISMSHKYYKSKKKIYSHLPIHLYTVNDKDELSKLIDDNAVKVILSDKSYYSFKNAACLPEKE